MSLNPIIRAALMPFAPRDTTVSCTHPDLDGEILVEGYYEAGSPGRISGPPEGCYPPEQALFEIHKVLIGGLDVIQLLRESVIEYLEEEALEKCEEAATEDRELAEIDRAEAMADAMRDL